MTPQGPAAFPNFRALGGQRTGDGRHVRDGLVFRSEAVLRPSPEDAAWLAAHGIALVCDLRGDAERTRAPNRWWAEAGVELLDLDLLAGIGEAHSPWPILRGDPSVANAHAVMRAVNAQLPRAAMPHVATLFGRIAAGDLPVLIHCTAGKDRTGFLSALLLAALGVPWPAIVEDYLASRDRRTDEVRAATRAMILSLAEVDLSVETLEALMGVEEAYLRAGFAAIEHDHGDVAGYLAAAGLSDAAIKAIRARLLVQAEPRRQPIT